MRQTKGIGKKIILDSASTSIGNSACEDKFKPAAKLQVEPFSIGSQKGKNVRVSGSYEGIQKLIVIHHQGVDA